MFSPSWYDPLVVPLVDLLWHELCSIDVQRMIQPIIPLLHEPDEVLAVIRQFNAQAQMILDEARQIAQTLDSSATIVLDDSGDEALIEDSLRATYRCLRYSPPLLEKASSFDSDIAKMSVDTPSYRLADYDDRDRRAIIVSYDWCYTLVILFDSLSNSRMADFGGTCVVFRSSSLPSSGENKSITFACICSGLQLRLRQVLKACVRPFIAPGKCMKGPAFIDLIALNSLESSVNCGVVHPIELLIERCKTLQLDCLIRRDLVSRVTDVSFISVVYYQIFIFLKLLLSATCVTCFQSIGSCSTGIVMFSTNRFEVLVFRFDEGIPCLTETPKIVSTSEHITQMFLVGDMIAEAIDHCPSQERMIACWQLFFRTLTLIRFSLEFLGVFQHIELNSTVSDFLD